MPTYEYRCKDCGNDLEVVQAFTDDPLTECPSCGGTLKKKFGTVGISFKGSGFYKNDSPGQLVERPRRRAPAARPPRAPSPPAARPTRRRDLVGLEQLHAELDPERRPRAAPPAPSRRRRRRPAATAALPPRGTRP